VILGAEIGILQSEGTLWVSIVCRWVSSVDDSKCDVLSVMAFVMALVVYVVLWMFIDLRSRLPYKRMLGELWQLVG
jgi:hypothetical protein